MSKGSLHIKKTEKFEKDLKKLLKKFRSIEEDFEIFIDTQLKAYHKLNIDNNGIFQIQNLGVSYPKIFKAKKFACKSLKGKGVMSGIRIIYAYHDQEGIIEFIEVYYKGDKINEDMGRIREYFKNLS